MQYINNTSKMNNYDNSKRIIKYWAPKPMRNNLFWLNFFNLPNNQFLFLFSNKPDYIFITEQMYCNKRTKYHFFKIAKKNSKAIRCFFTSTSITPDLNIFDYGFYSTTKEWNNNRIFSYQNLKTNIDLMLQIFDTHTIQRPNCYFVNQYFNIKLYYVTPLYKKVLNRIQKVLKR